MQLFFEHAATCTATQCDSKASVQMRKALTSLAAEAHQAAQQPILSDPLLVGARCASDVVDLAMSDVDAFEDEDSKAQGRHSAGLSTQQDSLLAVLQARMRWFHPFKRTTARTAREHSAVCLPLSAHFAWVHSLRGGRCPVGTDRVPNPSWVLLLPLVYVVPATGLLAIGCAAEPPSLSLRLLWAAVALCCWLLIGLRRNLVTAVMLASETTSLCMCCAAIPCELARRDRAAWGRVVTGDLTNAVGLHLDTGRVRVVQPPPLLGKISARDIEHEWHTQDVVGFEV